MFPSHDRGGQATIYYEQPAVYPYGPITKTNYISTVTASQSGVGITSSTTFIRSVGLGSKAFLIGPNTYFLAAYQSQYQSTYFLIGSQGSIVAKLAYGNGGGYLGIGLPNVSVTGNSASIPYLFKEEIQAVNKETNPATGVQTAGIYSQLGISYASFTFTSESLSP